MIRSIAHRNLHLLQPLNSLYLNPRLIKTLTQESCSNSSTLATQIHNYLLSKQAPNWDSLTSKFPSINPSDSLVHILVNSSLIADAQALLESRILVRRKEMEEMVEEGEGRRRRRIEGGRSGRGGRGGRGGGRGNGDMVRGVRQWWKWGKAKEAAEEGEVEDWGREIWRRREIFFRGGFGEGGEGGGGGREERSSSWVMFFNKVR